MSDTYSFQDVKATLVGVGGVIDLGAGSGNAEEGITVEMTEDQDVLTVGADGEYMHTLRVGKAGTITVRLLYTSNVNALLQTLFIAQRAVTKAWGANTITVRNQGNNELVIARGAAFTKQPTVTYSKDGTFKEWVFNCGKIDMVTGTY